MRKITVYGKIEEHKLILHNRLLFLEEISLIGDCEIELVIKKRGRKSNKQLGYLFGVVYDMCRIRMLDLGHLLDLNDVHSFFKSKFNTQYVCDEQGEVIGSMPGSIRDFNPQELSEYIEKIRQFASEILEINIPDPDPEYSNNL